MLFRSQLPTSSFSEADVLAMSSAYGTGVYLVHYLCSNTVLFIVFCFFATFLLLRKHRRSCLALPPGPKKLPIVGNLFQIPTSYEWEVYAKWCKEYSEQRLYFAIHLNFFFMIDSDVIHLDTAGTSIIIINSTRAANELFEKWSAIYSSQ